MSRLISLFVCLSLAVSMVACVTAPRAVPVPNLTVALNIRDSGNENTTEHHGHDETKTWTIGVIDSPNTINAMAYLQNYKQAMLGASNPGAYNDVNVEYLKSNISARLKKTFGATLKKSIVDVNDSKINYYVYVDLLATIGAMSNQSTNIELNLIFVNRNNEYMGKIHSFGAGVVPYPALSVGFTHAAKELSENLDTFLEGGVDFVAR